MKKNSRTLTGRIRPPRPQPLILMYHRIARDPVDVWDLAVSPENFEEQLAVLRRTRHPFPLRDFVSKLVSRTLPPDAVAVTFDDGYVDNLAAGKPRLAAADVPATVFLATGYLGRPAEYWWDELSRLILAGQGPRAFELVAGEKTVHVDLGASAISHKAPPATTPRQRQAALASIWEALRQLDENERQSAIAQIRSILTDRGNADRGRPMTREEVQTLASDGLVTIGAHTITHPQLSALGMEACQNEIAGSKSACEALIGAEVSGFAYPYGDFNDQARRTVSATGFAFACAIQHAPIRMDSDLFALPRMHVRNWDGDAFQRAIDETSGGLLRGARGALRRIMASSGTFPPAGPRMFPKLLFRRALS